MSNTFLTLPNLLVFCTWNKGGKNLPIPSFLGARSESQRILANTECVDQFLRLLINECENVWEHRQVFGCSGPHMWYLANIELLNGKFLIMCDTYPWFGKQRLSFPEWRCKIPHFRVDEYSNICNDSFFSCIHIFDKYLIWILSQTSNKTSETWQTSWIFTEDVSFPELIDKWRVFLSCEYVDRICLPKGDGTEYSIFRWWPDKYHGNFVTVQFLSWLDSSFHGASTEYFHYVISLQTHPPTASENQNSYS